MKGFSERVPEKNLRLLHGKPLFHWIMNSLTDSKFINEIIINTDSAKIAKSASDNYDVTLHMRPEHLLNIHHNEASQIIEDDFKLGKVDFFSTNQNFIAKVSTTL